MNTPRPRFVAPFPADYRAAGVLLHVTSLPSPYGIGDLGPSAIAWVDRLAAAGQSWWQVLPLGPTGFGHSPYQALSSFAANPLVISPDRLIEDGLLTAKECGGQSFPADYVDFDRVAPFKEALLDRAWENFKRQAKTQLHTDFAQFLDATAALQAEPALFMALRERFGQAHFTEWPSELERREPVAIAGRDANSPTRSTVSASASSASSASGTLSKTMRIDAACSCSATCRFSSRRILRTCGPIPSYFCWTQSKGRASSPAFRPTTSAPTASSGATRSMTGTP